MEKPRGIEVVGVTGGAWTRMSPSQGGCVWHGDASEGEADDSDVGAVVVAVTGASVAIGVPASPVTMVKPSSP